MDSDYPDSILWFIFNKLSLKDHVKTSILSKHWLHEWKSSSTHLNFDLYNTSHYNTLPTNIQLFQNLQSQFTSKLDQFMFHYQHATISSIRVNFPLGNKHSDVIDRLITQGIAKGIKHLELLFSHEPNFIIERYRFSFTLLSNTDSLTYLHLENCVLEVPKEFSGLKNLRTLVLDGFHQLVEFPFMRFLFEECLKLEDLTLKNFPITEDIEIISTKLLHLKIINCSTRSNSKISIDAENLISFAYSGDAGEFYIRAPKLMNVFWNAVVRVKSRDSLGPIPELHQVENLAIITRHSQISKLMVLARFQNLKQLELFMEVADYPFIEFFSILDVLIAFQHLQKFSLTITDTYWFESGIKRKFANFFHNELKFVELHGCVSTTHAIEFARCLLRNVSSLKKITFSSLDKYYIGAETWTKRWDSFCEFDGNFIYESLKDEVKGQCELIIL